MSLTCIALTVIIAAVALALLFPSIHVPIH